MLLKNANISQQGLNKIKEFEGKYNEAYDDGAGFLTIGYGHTNSTPPQFNWGDYWSDEQCEKVLVDDLNSHIEVAKNIVTIDLNQCQVDSIYSMVFNLGANMLTVYDLLDDLNNGNFEAFTNGLMELTHASGMFMEGLYKRRLWESEQFLNPCSQAEPPKPPENTEKPPIGGNGNNTKPETSEKPKEEINLKDGYLYTKNDGLYHSKQGLIAKRMRAFYFLTNKIKVENETDKENNNTGNNNTGAPKPPKEEEDKTDSKTKIEKFIKKLQSIPLQSLVYDNIRPQAPVDKSSYSDCSGFIGWGLSELIPECWNGGYTNTAIINEYGRKNGMIIAEGWGYDVDSFPFKRGDILLMGDDLTTGSGNNSHVICITGEGSSIDVGYTPCPNVHENSNNHDYWQHAAYVLMRPFK